MFPHSLRQIATATDLLSLRALMPEFLLCLPEDLRLRLQDFGVGGLVGKEGIGPCKQSQSNPLLSSP